MSYKIATNNEQPKYKIVSNICPLLLRKTDIIRKIIKKYNVIDIIIKKNNKLKRRTKSDNTVVKTVIVFYISIDFLRFRQLLI